MPALPQVMKTIKISLGWTLDGSPAGSRFFMSYTGGPPTTTDLTTFCGAIATQYSASFAGFFPTSTILTSVQAEDLNTSSGALGVVAVSVPGVNGGTALTANATLDVDFKIDRRYRGGHPRISFPAAAQDYLATNQKWGSTVIGDMNSDWGAFIVYLQSLSYTSFVPVDHVSVPYYKGVYTTTPPWRGPGFKYPPKPQTSPVTPDLVVSHSARTIVGSQRRRLTTP